mgnify:CR=1 FL=1
MSKIQKWDEINGLQQPEEKMQAFLDSATDAYAILQLKAGDATRDREFMSYSYLPQGNPNPNHFHLLRLVHRKK